MNDLLPFIITGIVTGSLYGLAALGLVLTYRTSGTFNFGHGAVAAAAAFLFYSLRITYGVPWPVAAVLTIAVFGFVIGAILERLTRTLRDAPQAVEVVATVGLLLGVQGLLYLIYGNVTRIFPPFLPRSGFNVAGVTVTWEQVIAILIASFSAAGLYLFLQHSRLGLAMRAVVDNPTLVKLTAESPVRVRRASWSIGAAFAALSGILLGPTLGLDALLLTLLVIQAFGAAAIGRFSNLPLTYLGGIGVGIAASLATKYFTEPPFSGVPSSMPFLALVLVLLTVPVAKLPQRRAGVGSLITQAPTMRRHARLAAVVLGVTVLLLLPLVVGSKLPVWTNALSSAVIFGSLGLLVWTSGQISLCQASFVALGATTFAHLTTDLGVPWGIALLAAGILTVPVGALVAIPAIRLSGIYLALATMGFAILMQNVVFPTFLMFGSHLSVRAPRPHLGFIDGTNDKTLYYVMLAVAALVFVSLAAIQRSRLGRLLRALSETPTMLNTHGLEVNRLRLTVFCLSAFFAGVGGALSITQSSAASGVAYGPIQSLVLLAVLALCGTRLVRSSILAALLFAVVPGYLDQFGADRQILAFGAIAILSALLVAKRSQFTAWVDSAAATTERRRNHGRIPHRRPRASSVWTPEPPETAGLVLEASR